MQNLHECTIKGILALRNGEKKKVNFLTIVKFRKNNVEISAIFRKNEGIFVLKKKQLCNFSIENQDL